MFKLLYPKTPSPPNGYPTIEHPTDEAALRAYATGLVAAALVSRQGVEFVVSKGFAGDLVRRLRGGPVADYLRAEAASVARTGDVEHLSEDVAAVLPAWVGGWYLGDAYVTNKKNMVGYVGGEIGCGRWPSIGAVEAEHVVACLSTIGGYQEVGGWVDE